MITLRDASLRYAPATHVLEGISLAVRQGEFVALLGPSGCGKSSLLRLIAGLMDPTGGELSIHGQSARRFRQSNHGVSLVFQEPRLLPWRNVRRNIAVPLELAQVPSAEQEGLIAASLPLIGLRPQDA